MMGSCSISIQLVSSCFIRVWINFGLMWDSYCKFEVGLKDFFCYKASLGSYTLLPKDYSALAGFPEISQFLESTDHFCSFPLSGTEFSFLG